MLMLDHLRKTRYLAIRPLEFAKLIKWLTRYRFVEKNPTTMESRPIVIFSSLQVMLLVNVQMSEEIQ